jgi:hypothetical protein
MMHTSNSSNYFKYVNEILLLIENDSEFNLIEMFALLYSKENYAEMN